MKIVKLYFALAVTMNSFAISGYAQYEHMKYKALKNKDFDQYLKDNHGKLVPNPYFDDCNFYECDNNTLIIENTREKRMTLYFDRLKWYTEMDKVIRRSKSTPLKGKQDIVRHIRENKDELVRQLFSELKLKQPDDLLSTNLGKLDSAIRAYGYENAYENLTLNLIVFAGEYIREKKGGYWLVEVVPRHPEELQPLFIDSSGKKYEFEFNIQIQKQFLEKGKFKMTEIIEFALLPPIFKAVRGPRPLH